MKYRYEGINHHSNLPVKIFIHRLKQVAGHWHEELEILFILKGQITVGCGGVKKILNETDIFLINSSLLHSTEAAADNLVLALQIKQDYFNAIYPRFSKLFFACDSAAAPDNRERYDVLRMILAQLMNAINKQEEWYLFSAISCLNRLCFHLAKNFVKGYLDQAGNIDPNNDKLTAVIDYIADHYQDNIGIIDISDHLHLSKDYLSRYFSKYMGMSPAKYLADIRLKKSINLLTDTELNITEIAYACGFTLPKSYFSAFRKAYHTTPMAYRKALRQERQVDEFDYLNIDLRDSFAILYQFLPQQNGSMVQVGEELFIEELLYEKTEYAALTIDVTRDLGSFRNNTAKIGCFGRAAEGLRASWREQFCSLQQEIGFKYMRFHGIFHDDMMVYNETAAGVSYDFTYVDDLFDFLLSHQARPFIELGFMPRQLASDDAKVFWWGGHASPPRDMDKWLALVEAFIRHLLFRYGESEVGQWYFEIWNEPDLSAFWNKGREAFFEFFRDTFYRLKQLAPGLRVGGFSLASCHIGELFDYLAARCREEGLRLDFFTYHAYPFKTVNPLELDSLQDGDRSTLFPQLFQHYYRRGEPDYLQTYSREIKNKVAKFLPAAGELFVTEFNASFYPRELILDTCYMAAFIVKNLLYFNQHTDGAGYWIFTDIFEEMPTVGDEFHGGFGLMTRHGIRKPHYYAYMLLKKLAGTILYQSDECIAVMSETGQIRILFYHYVHLDKLYSQMDTSGITRRERNNCFESVSPKQIEWTVNNINGHYKTIEHRISTQWGSAFDKWVEMGAPEPMSAAEIDYLASMSKPLLRTKVVNVADELRLSTVLKPHDVVLYELIPL